MLWLALYFPQLPLTVLTRGSCDSSKPVVIHEQRQYPTLCHCNSEAKKRGIHPGITLAAAHSLTTGLIALPRDPELETRTLQRLAGWGQQFTHHVSLESNSLLLEIGGSLKLFGAPDALQSQISRELASLGYPHVTGMAPTPLAALWFAHARYPRVITRQRDLQQALSTLPVQALSCSEKQLENLQGMGCRKLAQVFRLPAASLARRLGPDFVQMLDKALGQLPDPRKPWQAPPHFNSQILLPEPVISVEPLFFLLQRLLLELSGFLRGHGAGIQSLQLDLLYPSQQPDTLTLGLCKPTRDASRLLHLWREKLEQFLLKTPAEGLRLRADQLQPLTPESGDLLDAHHNGKQDTDPLLEQLQTRLGDGCIKILDLHADHRPELATTTLPATAALPAETVKKEVALPQVHRPLWLLDPPGKLQTSNGQPQLDGALQLLQGPERIETGWWDGQDIRRDYYIATNHHQQKLWIYRLRGSANSWYLHGYFA